MPSVISWQISQVNVAGFSTWSSMAFSPTGQASIGFYSSDKGAVRFAALNASGTWDVETVDESRGESGPHLRYLGRHPSMSYVSGGELKYAIRRGKTPPWYTERLASADPGNSLAIDTRLRTAISYHKKDGGLAYFGSRAPTVWVGSAVDAEVKGRFNSLAFGPADQLSIAYHDPVSSFGNARDDLIKYAAFDGTHWKIQTVGPGNGWCTLAFSPAGEPAVAYDLSPNSVASVMYSVLRGGSWHTETIAEDANSPSLAFTRTGGPAISYYDKAAAAVKYAEFVNGAWHHVLVDQTGKLTNGGYSGEFTLTSLAINATGTLAISYFDRHNGTIKCAIRKVELSGLDWLLNTLRNLLP